MKNSPTISIGIPAYNEEGNIKQLVTALLAQNQKNFVLKEIIVLVDGGEDNTVAEARSIRDRRVKVIAGTKRKGQLARQNQLLKTFQGDILVLAEADTLPASRNTLAHLIKPFSQKSNHGLGMVIGDRRAVEPRGFFEKVLAAGDQIKSQVFRSWKGGENLYMATGHVFRAIPRAVAEQINWPEDVPEDSYLYLHLKKQGFSIKRQALARSYMKHVTSPGDRLRQCRKFRSGKKALSHHFEYALLKEETSLPIRLIGQQILKGMLTSPFWSSLALLEMVANRTVTLWSPQFNSLYLPYQSSKLLVVTET